MSSWIAFHCAVMFFLTIGRAHVAVVGISLPMVAGNGYVETEVAEREMREKREPNV